MNRKILHEVYHSKIKLQRRIVDLNNFTYRNTLYYVCKYFSSSKKILDVGCGTGTVDFFIAQNDKHVLGIDISSKAILAAKKNSVNFGLEKNVRFRVLDFPDKKIKGKFDGVLVSEVFEHLKSDLTAIKAINKLCRKGAIVIASSPSKNAPLYRLGLLKDFDSRVGHVRRYTSKGFYSLFDKNGFEIIEFFKTEGILRNLLFTNNFTGNLIRFIRGPLSDLVTVIDNLLIPVFGESDYYIVARKE